MLGGVLVITDQLLQFWSSLISFPAICLYCCNCCPGEIEDDEKELEHTSLQEILDKELKELDKKLEQKEVYHDEKEPLFWIIK